MRDDEPSFRLSAALSSERRLTVLEHGRNRLLDDQHAVEDDQSEADREDVVRALRVEEGADDVQSLIVR